MDKFLQLVLFLVQKFSLYMMGKLVVLFLVVWSFSVVTLVDSHNYYHHKNSYFYSFFYSLVFLVVSIDLAFLDWEQKLLSPLPYCRLDSLEFAWTLMQVYLRMRTIEHVSTNSQE